MKKGISKVMNNQPVLIITLSMDFVNTYFPKYTTGNAKISIGSATRCNA